MCFEFRPFPNALAAASVGWFALYRVCEMGGAANGVAKVLDEGGHMDPDHVSRLTASNDLERIGGVSDVVEAARGAKQQPAFGTWTW